MTYNAMLYFSLMTFGTMQWSHPVRCIMNVSQLAQDELAAAGRVFNHLRLDGGGPWSMNQVLLQLL